MFSQFFVVVSMSYKSIVCNICLNCKARFPYSLQLKICAMLSPFVYNMFRKQFVLLFFVQFGLYADYKLSIPYSIRLLSLSDWIACCFFCCCRFVGNDGGVSPNWTQMEFALPQTIRNTLIYGSQVQSRNNIAMNIVFTISY